MKFGKLLLLERNFFISLRVTFEQFLAVISSRCCEWQTIFTILSCKSSFHFLREVEHIYINKLYDQLQKSDDSNPFFPNSEKDVFFARICQFFNMLTLIVELPRYL